MKYAKYTLVFALAVLAVASPAALSKVVQQQTVVLKEFDLNKPGYAVPYKISGVKNENTAIGLGISTSVDGVDEWIKKLAFSFTNTSEKSMSRVLIKLWLLNPDSPQPSAKVPLFFFASKSVSPLFPDVADLEPGEKLQVTFQEKYYESLQRLTQKVGLLNSDRIRDITICVDSILFSDGTTWSYGKYYRPDPKDPSRFIPLE